MSEPLEPTPRFQFRSDLSQIPLPEVLMTIHRYRVPGVVVCEREGETKKIFIEEGNIIFATSTNVADSLGDRLLAQEKITMEQYRESVRRLVQENGKRQGAILVEMRAIEPKDLFIAVREQVEAIVWSLFNWESGSVVFEPGRDRHQEFIKLNIPTPRAVIDGVRQVPDAKRLVARVGQKATLLERNAAFPVADLPLQPAEEQLLNAIDGKMTLYDLISLNIFPPAEAAKMLYSFYALKLITVKQPKQIKVQVRGK
jgi:hypothetical protein